MTLTVGQRVLLVDGRGCSFKYALTRFDSIDSPHIRVIGRAWKSLPFRRTTRETIEGYPVLRAAKPAIGPAERQYHPMYLPGGWSPPSALRARLKADELKPYGQEFSSLDDRIKKQLRGVENAIAGPFSITGKWSKLSRVELPADVKKQYTTSDPKGRFLLTIEKL